MKQQENVQPTGEPVQVTPPPFRPEQEPVAEEQTAPSLDEKIAALELDETASRQLSQLTQGLEASAVTAELLTTLARGLSHDEDVKNADAAGYLRGRNDKIETLMHPQPDEEDQPIATPVFPRYCRRSIWD